MSRTFLETIVESKRVRVEAAKRAVSRSELTDRARAMRSGKASHRLRDALADGSRINIIAEFKRASPSKGVINNVGDPAELTRQYQRGGAVAVSVLTEEDHFKGSINDLISVREAVELPILRKDFIFDSFQIYEAAAAGADAILLIAAMLSNTQIADLEALAEDDFGMDALIEVHSVSELERFRDSGAKLIGVNNRDLRTFEVSLDTSRDLIGHAPPASLLVAESGLTNRENILELKRLGYDGFLIGEALMRSGDAVSELRKLNDQG